MKKRKRDMDWLALEMRLRQILKNTIKGAKTGGAAWRDGIIRMDAALAAYTRRGSELEFPESDVRENLLVSGEWDRLEGGIPK